MNICKARTPTIGTLFELKDKNDPIGDTLTQNEAKTKGLS